MFQCEETNSGDVAREEKIEIKHFHSERYVSILFESSYFTSDLSVSPDFCLWR